MSKKVLLSVILACATVPSFAQAATTANTDTQAQQAKKGFEEFLVKPCEGKKVGDQVEILTPRGLSVMATCKMAAEINIK